MRTIRYVAFLPLHFALVASFHACASSDDAGSTTQTATGAGGSATSSATSSSAVATTTATSGSGGETTSATTSGTSSSGGTTMTGASTGTGGAAGNAGSGGAAGSAGSRDGGTDARPVDAGSDGADASNRDGGLYNPCPAKGKPCVILPVGDSITAGSGSSNGGSYRAPLFHLANMNMQSITFVGPNVNGPTTVDGLPFPRANSGYSGYNIDNAAGRMGISPFFPGYITTYKPNIVLLMIGTNDVDTGETDPPTRLAMLMDSMLNADPALLLVVAQIVPQQKMPAPDTKNMQVDAYNAAIAPLVTARANAGKHIVMVDMHGAFTANPNYSTVYLTDRLHPNDAGYQVMADTWYKAIGGLLR